MTRRPRIKPWVSAATKYALPNLPGEWVAQDHLLLWEPVGMIARGISVSHRVLNAVLHPLYLPVDYETPSLLIAHDCLVYGSYPSVKSVADGAPVMARIVEDGRSRIVPFLKENGSLEGYFNWCQRVNDSMSNGVGDSRTLYRQSATAITLERYDEAAQLLDGVQAVISLESPPIRDWVRTLARQAAELLQRLRADPKDTREALLAGMAEQRRRLGLHDNDD